MSSCSVDGCKRSIACLCRHCEKDVCSKHFNEHQIEVNNELIPITDRLNECKDLFFVYQRLFRIIIFILVKMRIRIDDKTGPLEILQKWKDKKLNEINEEYNRKVKEFETKISKYDQQITRLISNIEELINEGDVSVDQVKQIQKTIDNLTNEINTLLTTEPINEILDTYVQMGGVRYLVKAKIKCNNTDLYAIESERPLVGYNGLCPQCNKAHVVFETNRGFYVLCKTLHNKL
jgi:DNA repair exonuclease SbcCD ATPase subunit